MNRTSIRLASIASLALLALGAVAACSGGDSAPPAGNPDPSVDASADAPATDAPPATDAGTDAPSVDASAAFAQIDALIEDARSKKSPTPAVGFALYDKDNKLVYGKTYGSYALNQRVAIASASKMVSGLVLLALVGKGTLSLDSTTGDVLGWQPPKANITLRHLLSFTSGMPPEAACTFDPETTLAACVDTIAAGTPKALPGKLFEYGSAHLHIAARMAEVKTGKSWATLFDENVRVPLGLPADVAYFTFPKGKNGTTNPLIAGGLRTSSDEYARILDVVFHRGAGLGIPDALFTEQAKEPFPDVEIGGSPANGIGVPWHYGLTAWLECSSPATGCAAISSPGTYGFTPWLDRETGYYAVLGMELGEAGSGDFAVPLQQSLKPAIAAALGK